MREVREVRHLGIQFKSEADFPAISAVIRSAGSVALDLETYGPRKSDGLDPWVDDIRLLSLNILDAASWLLDRQHGWAFWAFRAFCSSAKHGRK